MAGGDSLKRIDPKIYPSLDVHTSYSKEIDLSVRRLKSFEKFRGSNRF